MFQNNPVLLGGVTRQRQDQTLLMLVHGIDADSCYGTIVQSVAVNHPCMLVFFGKMHSKHVRKNMP